MNESDRRLRTDAKLASRIGRITEGLLSGVATEIDVVEPIAKFTATLEAKKINGVRNIYTMGLEEWADVRAQPELQYDLIWVQWCVGHLTDDQLVRFLDRCRAVLNADGVIVLKENLSTNGADAHDEVDSSVTR
jgi:protein N-terminal methyltransferase